jgi:hypothetical protein
MNTVNQYQVDPASGHPADIAMSKEAAGGAPGSTLTAQELAHFSQLDPANLVAELANSREQVPANSPLRQLSSDQLRDEMRKSMTAIQDFRSAQQSIGVMDGKIALAQSNPTNANMRGVLAARGASLDS